MLLHVLGEVYERELRGVRFQREHAVSDEASAAHETVQSAYQIVLFIPHFDALCVAHFVQLEPCLDEFRTEPCEVFLKASVGQCAAVDNAVEILVDGAGVSLPFQQRFHGMRYLDLIGEYDEPFMREPPDDRLLPEGEIGEYAHRIRLDEPLGREVSSDGVKAVFPAVSRVWEFGCITQFEYHILCLLLLLLQ